MSTFVLVHGGFHGGWCWRRVIGLLRSHGHRADAPTLSGLGERRHIRQGVNLTTHVNDVLGVLDFEDLAEVTLVGCSYGGVVVTAVADARPDRIRQLIYVDATVPSDGESAFDFYDDRRKREWLNLARDHDGWIPVPDLGSTPFGITQPADAAWVVSRLTPHPFQTVVQKVELSGYVDGLNRTYIRCTSGSPIAAVSAARIRSRPRWKYIEMDSGHDAMVIAPAELAALLLSVAE